MRRRATLTRAALVLACGCAREGGCAGPSGAGETVPRTLSARIDVRAPERPGDVGYGAPFALEAVDGWPEAGAGSIRWRQVSGPPLRGAHATGSRFEARMPAEAEVALEAPAWGIVPVSPRTSGEVVIEAEWRPPADASRAPVRRRVRLAAASRSRGVPTVAVDSGVLLAGSGWSVAAAPRGAGGAVGSSGGLAHLVPDAAGEWILRDASGRTLSLRAGRYDETRLDCGRSGCHGAIAEAVAVSPMTLALRRQVDAPSAGGIECTLACHATGELDTRDGGFTDVARALPGVALAAGGWLDLPRSLRRLGGVTCLACHGPSAIPEPSARWAILRADVCATCHDAPPEYGHVAAWRTSRMARSDADPRTRAVPACARCHTTSGFLATLRGHDDAREAPAEAGPGGVACAACHAVHEPRGGPVAAHALLREPPLPPSFEGAPIPGTSRVCVSCHAPDGALSAAASAAAIWAGRAGVDPDTGAPLAGAFVHGAVAGGCVGCHRAGPGGLERGAGHAFGIDRRACAGCHAASAPDAAAIGRTLQDDAAALLARLARMGAPGAAPREPPSVPRHAAQAGFSPDRVGRAAYDVTLVLEDPAAAVHNAPYARALLDAARSVTGATMRGGSP